ncbi:acyltransferase [Arthrobacter zhangbolii]|uniref:Acyltransferase n=1 Tax=Arthrobacter zhangbolii TaxID=2886936 RepID=A0A9X1M8V1_9MICC|nr:acyltransferase family protein [Arthrobacter zhangbolii]MCC3272494.1 acyltransferase [Arthrobacter zhangbolii]UON91651.1 acyltransferase [Arthrobacter zhangbolii]
MAVAATQARHRSKAAPPAGKRFRTDIQAMRALAVSLVVLNHLWPQRLPGGYVGVDVFFVISGFLITSHLVREIEATGRLRLGAFYARRARRLFPAAFLVLAASMLLTLLFLPYPQWMATAQEVLASVFYAENWLLAAKSVDYSAMTEAASAVQHYWSLSVEEQFYLLWPLALILFAALARRRGRHVRNVLLLAVFGVAAMSLLYSVYVTVSSPEQAYFVTPARVWEFAVGAGVGLAAVQLRSIVFRNVLAIAGFGLILASALTFDAETPFPGWTALAPVLGSALVILAGAGRRGLIHDVLTALPPVQFVGKISYSLYLWHWPLIVVAPYALGVVPTAPYKLGILAAAILLAWGTKRWVEDTWIKPGSGRTRRHIGRHAAQVPGFRAPVAGMAAVAVAAALLGVVGDTKEEQALELAAAGASGPCYGVAALENRECSNPFAIPVAVPHMGKENEYWTLPTECAGTEDKMKEGGGPVVCDFSGGNPEAETAWLVGDSHAQHWQEPVLMLGKEHGWKVNISYLGACPLLDAPIVSYQGKNTHPAYVEYCQKWGRYVTDTIEEDAPDRVFVSMFVAGEVIDDGTGASQNEQYIQALSRDWQRWVDAGSVVIPLADPPLNGMVRDPMCLSLNSTTPLECAAPREQAVSANPFAGAAERMGSENVRPVDLTDFFCDLRNCYAAVGGMSVYFDGNHMNAQYSRQLAPHIATVLD